jgi:hypothetical protein
MFVINIVAVISNLYVDVCAFLLHYSIFFRVPLDVLVRTPGGTRTPVWESMVYGMVKFQYKLPDKHWEIRTIIIVLLQSLPLVSILSRIKPIYTLYFPVHFTVILPSVCSVFQVIFLP